MNPERYSPKCANCPNWKYQCWIQKAGDIEPQKCTIYTAHKNQVSQNWESIGIRSK